MLSGGYKIINLNDINLSDNPVIIKGIYDEIEGSHRKPILLSGIVIDNVEKQDAFIVMETLNNSFTISIYGGIIEITSDDEVKFITN